jgi:CubicO group peptidase (beta-lactamase class C family)
VFGALLLAALVVFGCAPAPSDPHGEGASSGVVSGEPEIERLIPELMTRARVPGLQIALIRDGRIVLERGFGTTGGPDGAAVDTDTVFEAASLTKPLFAYVVMTLVDEGVVDLGSMSEAALADERAAFEARWVQWNTIRTVLAVLTSVLLITLAARAGGLA